MICMLYNAGPLITGLLCNCFNLAQIVDLNAGSLCCCGKTQQYVDTTEYYFVNSIIVNWTVIIQWIQQMVPQLIHIIVESQHVFPCWASNA